MEIRLPAAYSLSHDKHCITNGPLAPPVPNPKGCRLYRFFAMYI